MTPGSLESLVPLVKELGRVSEAAEASTEAICAVAEVAAGPDEVVGLHEAMSYSPREIATTVREVCADSEAHARSLAEGLLTGQGKGEVAERLLHGALESFGRVEKLAVAREAGSHTADFLVRLERPLMGFKPGQTIIVECKFGDAKYVLSELRDAQSHGRLQLAETMARHDADGAICAVPREIQNHRAVFEEIRTSMAAENQRLWMGLPHEGSLRAAARIAGSSAA